MNIEKLSEIIKNSFQAIKNDMNVLHQNQTMQVKAVDELYKELQDLKEFNNKVVADILRRLAKLEKASKNPVKKKKAVKKKAKKKVKKSSKKRVRKKK